MRSILLHIDNDEGLEARMEAALSLARAFDGHVTCLQVVTTEMGVPGDLYGAMAAQVVPEMRRVGEELRRKLEADLSGEDVAWDYFSEEGLADDQLLARSSLSDLVVLGPGDNSRGSSLPGTIALQSRTPILLVPASASPFDPQGPALVGWDGSPESSRALRASLPLLMRSQEVVLATVAEKGDEDGYDLPPVEGAEYLSRHGVSSSVIELPRGDKSVAQVLGEAARARKAAYLVVGAYGHSRLAEAIWGGTTREFFADPPLPIVACH